MIIPDEYRPHLHEDLEAHFRTLLYEDMWVEYYATRAGYEGITVRVPGDIHCYINEKGEPTIVPSGNYLRTEWRPKQERS